MKKKKTIIILSIVGIILILGIGISLAIYTYSKLGTRLNETITGTLKLEMSETLNSGIVIEKGIPTPDVEGKKGDAYNFVVKNTGTLDIKYRISLILDEKIVTADGCSSNLLANNYIRYSLNDGEAKSLSNVILEEGTITGGASRSYNLKLWIDINAGNEIMGRHYHGTIKVEGIPNNFEF